MEVYFWSFLVAVVLFVGGGVVAFMEGLNRLRHPHPDEGGIAFNLIVLGIAAFFEIVVAFRVALKEFNRRRGTRGWVRSVQESKDPTLLVVLFEDSVAVLGLLVAAAGLLLAHWTGESYWDAVASMAIGVLLAATACILAVETKGLLMGESAGRETRASIRAAVLAVPRVERIDRMLTMHLGPEEILVNMDLVVDPGLSEAEGEGLVQRVEEEIRRLVPEATRVFIELGPGD
jgi:cation diffusion facilitator family transporter